MSLLQQIAENLGATGSVGGSWMQTIAIQEGATGPVGGSWIQSWANAVGVTGPIGGSWIQAIADHYGVTGADGDWLIGIEINTATPPFDPDAQAFITASGISGTNADAINDLVLDLKSASLWTKLLAFYPLIGGNSSAHQYNLKNIALYNLTFSGTVNHTADGIQSSSAGYADTNWAPSSIPIIWQKGSWGFYVQNDFTISLYDSPMGSVDGNDNRMSIFTVGAESVLIDWGSAGTPLRYGPGVGLQSGQYINYVLNSGDNITGKTSINGVFNCQITGTISGDKPSASTANMTLLKRTDCCPFNGTLSSAFIGYQLSDSDAVSLAGIINDYQTTLSRNTY